MQAKTHQDLHESDALRSEQIVEPAVWVPDFPGDEPNLDYADWRDLLFVHGTASAEK